MSVRKSERANKRVSKRAEVCGAYVCGRHRREPKTEANAKRTLRLTATVKVHHRGLIAISASLIIVTREFSAW